MINTGIDITEYRSQNEIDWLGQRVRSLDPYGHPVSSRRGGGSGNIVMSGETFNQDTWFRMANFEQDLESEKFLVLINPFLENQLGDLFGEMVPENGLVDNGYALADPARSRILVFLMGVNDEYDSGNGGSTTVDLAGLTGPYEANWLNPRSGNEIAIGTLPGGDEHTLSPPSSDDWILLLSDTSVPGTSIFTDGVESGDTSAWSSAVP